MSVIQLYIFEIDRQTSICVHFHTSATKSSFTTTITPPTLPSSPPSRLQVLTSTLANCAATFSGMPQTTTCCTAGPTRCTGGEQELRGTSSCTFTIQYTYQGYIKKHSGKKEWVRDMRFAFSLLSSFLYVGRAPFRVPPLSRDRHLMHACYVL